MTTHPDLTTAAAYMDEAMKAIALAKQALTGGAGGALFLSSGPDLAAAEASPGNPYGSSVPLASLRDREHYDAGSAAGDAEPDGTCTATRPGNGVYRCVLLAGHLVLHEDITGHRWPGSAAEVAEGVDDEAARVQEMYDEPSAHLQRMWTGNTEAIEDARNGGRAPYADFCPAQWGEPPETMLCSLASGHDGNHATAEGIEWGGRWETAEPGRCGTADHPGACVDPWQETAEPHGGAR